MVIIIKYQVHREIKALCIFPLFLGGIPNIIEVEIGHFVPMRNRNLKHIIMAFEKLKFNLYFYYFLVVQSVLESCIEGTTAF